MNLLTDNKTSYIKEHYQPNPKGTAWRRGDLLIYSFSNPFFAVDTKKQKVIFQADENSKKRTRKLTRLEKQMAKQK